MKPKLRAPRKTESGKMWLDPSIRCLFRNSGHPTFAVHCPGAGQALWSTPALPVPTLATDLGSKMGLYNVSPQTGHKPSLGQEHRPGRD